MQEGAGGEEGPPETPIPAQQLLSAKYLNCCSSDSTVEEVRPLAVGCGSQI